MQIQDGGQDQREIFVGKTSSVTPLDTGRLKPGATHRFISGSQSKDDEVEVFQEIVHVLEVPPVNTWNGRRTRGRGSSSI